MNGPTARPLEGKTALVTGASRRLGRAIAERLHAAGARLALHAHRDRAGLEATARLLSAPAAPVLTFTADLRDASAAENLVAQAWEGLGGLDLLVNNVGILEHTPLAALDAEAFDRAMAVNARPVYLLSLAAGRRMKARGQGAIVNVACTSGLKAWGGYVPYSASKAAVVSLTQGFAKALAPEVRVNAVAPGPVLAPERLDEAQRRAIAATTLLGRWGEPADVAEAVLLLASQPWLTGVVLPVDGGRTT